MNILYLCDEYPPGPHGGVGTAVQLQARGIAQEGHRVIIAGFSFKKYGNRRKFEDGSVQIYRFGLLFSSRILRSNKSVFQRAVLKGIRSTGMLEWDIKYSFKRYYRILELLIRKYEIDIVEMTVGQYYMTQYFMLPLESYSPFPKLSVPTIVKIHGSLPDTFLDSNRPFTTKLISMEKESLFRADAVCAVSNYSATKVREFYQYDKPIRVLYNAINLNEITTTDKKIPKVVIYTGTLSKNKGTYQLMKAWNIVASQHPDSVLWLYGKGSNTDIKEILDASIVSTVKFYGRLDRSHLLKELPKASIAVFPSYAENFAFAPMEAMASGTATIFTKRTSGPELIENGVDGILVDPDNVVEIADAIIYLLQNDAARAEMAMKGKKKIQEQFDIKTSVTNHLEYYREVINNSVK